MWNPTHSGGLQILSYFGALVIYLLAVSYTKFLDFLLIGFQQPKPWHNLLAHIVCIAWITTVIRQIYGLAITETDERFYQQVARKFSLFDKKIAVFGLLFIVTFPVIVIQVSEIYLSTNSAIYHKQHCRFMDEFDKSIISPTKIFGLVCQQTMLDFFDGKKEIIERIDEKKNLQFNDNNRLQLIVFAIVFLTPLWYLIWDISVHNTINICSQPSGQPYSRLKRLYSYGKNAVKVCFSCPIYASDYREFTENWIRFNMWIVVILPFSILSIIGLYSILDFNSFDKIEFKWLVSMGHIIFSTLGYSFVDLKFNGKFYFPDS